VILLVARRPFAFDVSTTIELMWDSYRGFRRIVKITKKADSAGWAGGRAEGLKIRRQGFEDSGLDGEEGELPFPANVDEAAGLEFLDVMGEGGRGDGKGFVRGGAAEGALRAGDCFEKFETFGIGEGLEDGAALGAGEADGPGGGGGFRFWFGGRHVYFGGLDAMVMDCGQAISLWISQVSESRPGHPVTKSAKDKLRVFRLRRFCRIGFAQNDSPFLVLSDLD
jgi:hypothetical protein